MFRMEFQEIGASLTLRIEGRFVAHFADEALALVARRKIPATLTVNITEMTFVDSHGEHALTWLSQLGATFVAERSYGLDVCERLSLPLAEGSIAMERPQTAAD
jgi:hypothetical protein